MAEFIVRARAAPTDPDRFLGKAGDAGHVEFLAQLIVNTLFVSKGHRAGTTLTLVLESSADYARALVLDGDRLGSLGDKREASLLELLAAALRAGQSLGREQIITADSGISVQAISFERLVKQKRETSPVYLLDRKGGDIRDAQLAEDGVFLLTDHVPMPKKVARSLVRQGVVPVSLGPVMLHASQCVVLIQNELDRRF